MFTCVPARAASISFLHCEAMVSQSRLLGTFWKELAVHSPQWGFRSTSICISRASAQRLKPFGVSDSFTYHAGFFELDAQAPPNASGFQREGDLNKCFNYVNPEDTRVGEVDDETGKGKRLREP